MLAADTSAIQAKLTNSLHQSCLSNQFGTVSSHLEESMSDAFAEDDLLTCASPIEFPEHTRL